MFSFFHDFPAPRPVLHELDCQSDSLTWAFPGGVPAPVNFREPTLPLLTRIMNWYDCYTLQKLCKFFTANIMMKIIPVHFIAKHPAGEWFLDAQIS
jgi:hypothetical protein